jgi:probable selenium-dependent hydroxylase accessory protein YqeC
MPGPEDSPHTLIAGSIEDLIKASKSCLETYPHFSAARARDRRSGKLRGFDPDLINQLWETHIFDWIILEADGAKRKPLKASNPHEPVIPGRTSHLVLVSGLDAVGTRLDEVHVHRAGLFSENTGLPLGNVLDEQTIARGITVEMKKAMGFCPAAKKIVFLNKADTGAEIKSGRKIARFLRPDPAIGKILIGSLKQGGKIIAEDDRQDPKRDIDQKNTDR